MADGNVQLRLQASLDLAFLRAQVASIGKSLKTSGVSVVVTLDTKQFQKDVAKLTKEIRIKVNDSALDATVNRIKTVESRLKELQKIDNKVVIGVAAQAAVDKKGARKVRADVYRGIMANGGKILLPVGLQPISRSAVDSFKADLQKKLGTITVNVKANLEGASVRAGAKSQAEIDADVRRGLQAISEMGASRMAGGAVGGVTEAARRESLRKNIEDLTVAQLKQVAKQLEVGGVSKLRRADLINKIVADASVDMVKKYLDPQAMMRGGDRGQLQKVLDTFARGVFHMLGMDPAQARAQQQARRVLPAVNWQAQVPERPTPIGPSATGRALPGAPAPAMLGGTSFASQKRLVGDILSPSLKEVLRGAANAFVDSVRREKNAAVRSVRVRDFGNAISQVPMLPAAAPQAMLPAGRRGGALAVQGELGDFYRTVEVQVRNTFDIIADYHERSLRNFQRSYQQAISNYHQNILTAAASRSLRPAQVVDLGPSARPALAGAAPPMLPPAGGSGFRGGGGFVPPGGFPSDGPQWPSRPARTPQTELPSGYTQASQFANSLRGADQFLRQARVPLAGAIEELGGEFAQATKQVLLYGTAYKGLAFFMDLPNQALSAATALQTFRNQLNAVTGSADNANRSFSFVDGLAERFAVPLASVRQGFVRMYASMEPAGFGASEIEGLFSGISKAAATFGMSREQVDRVTYAFSQMASKGQIMAEELRGQLGDVLPGSLALFAKAAQMELPEFTKAMEDGRFSGEAMRVVLNNVAILLNQQFAKGAEGAANTLQGALNQMQNGLQKLYEAFEPLVNEVAQQVFPLISGAIGDATKAVQAFTAATQGNTGPSAQLAGNAQKIYQVFQQVVEIASAVQSTLASIGPLLQALGEFALLAATQLARFVNTPVGGFLASFALKLALATAALQLLARTGILAVVAAMVRMITAMRGGATAMIALGNGARAAGISLATLRTGLVALGSTAVLAGIMLLVERFMMLRGAVDGVRQSTQSMLGSISSMAQGGAVRELRNMGADLQKQISTFEQLKPFVSGGAIGPAQQLTPEAAQKMKDVGLGGFLGTTVLGKPVVTDWLNASKVINERLAGLRKQAESVSQKLPEAMQAATSVAATANQALTAVPPGAGDANAAAEARGKAAQDAEKLDEAERRRQEQLQNQEQQRILQNAELRAKMQELDFGQRKTLLDEALEATKNAIDAEYDYKLSKANEIQSVQLRLEKQLADSRLNAAKAVDNALLRMEEARLRTSIQQQRLEAAKQADALAPMQPSGGTLPMSMRVDLPAGAPAPLALPAAQNAGGAQRLIQVANKNLGLFAGSTERCADAIRVLFKEAGIAIGVTKKAWDGLDSGARLASSFFGSDIGQRITRQQDLRPGDLVGFERTYGNWGPGVQTHVGMYAGEGMMYDHSSRKGLVKRPMSTFAGKFMYGVRPAALGGAAGTAPAPLSGSAFSVEKRAQDVENDVAIAKREEEVAGIVTLSGLNNELQRAMQQARVDIAQAIGATLPVEQLRLENELLARRTELMLQGVPDEVIEGEEKRLMALRQSEGLQAAISDSIKRTELRLSDYKKKLAEGGPNQAFYANAVKNTEENLAIKRAELARIGPELQRYNLEVLKNTLAELQNADALKKVRDTIETIERVVGDTMGSYKNFLVNVAKGEGLTKSLKEFQNALRDQALTLFFDFAMKPMQKFMEDSLKGIFNVPTEDQVRQEQIRKLQEQIDATRANTDAINANTNAQGGTGTNLGTAAVGGIGASDFIPLTGGLGRAAVDAPFGVDVRSMVDAEEGIRATSESMYQLGATMPALGQGVGQLTQNFATSAIQSGAAAKTWQQSLGATVQSIGMAAGAVMSIAGGVSQIKEGGVSGVLGGIGSIFMGIGGALGGLGGAGGLGGLFGGGSSFASNIPFDFVSAPNIFGQLAMPGFANGGIVNGPTLGLVGEGKYNEAIVPLPDGRSIPVKMAGGQSAREAMSNGGMPSYAPSTVSFSFETTKINGVEYVSRDQLELAMASTRREAIKEGAKRGMSMTLDKIQQSPGTRRSIAMGRR